jgi:hypothetical protein
MKIASPDELNSQRGQKKGVGSATHEKISRIFDEFTHHSGETGKV